MITKDELIAVIESPKELEYLYQNDPKGFTQWFPEVFTENPDSSILQTWNERLNYTGSSDNKIFNRKTTNRKLFILAIGLGLLTGMLSILPLIFEDIISEDIYNRIIILLILSPLLIYMGITNLSKPIHIIFVSIAVSGLMLFLILQPEHFQSDTYLLSPIFAPFLFWLLISFTFCADKWKDYSKRNEFLDFSGKVILLTIIFYICWIILVYLVEIIFDYIVTYSYFRWDEEFMIFGLAFFPTISAHLLKNDPRFRLNFTANLSRFFIPIAILAEIYLIILVNIHHQKPVSVLDLMFASILLMLFTLILTILSISDRTQNSSKNIIDGMTLVLVGTTLISGIIVLISFFLQTSFSTFSVLFIAGIGTYIMFMIHLSGFFDLYIEFLRKKATMKAIQHWTSKLMPIYALWLLFVVIGLPIIYDFL